MIYFDKLTERLKNINFAEDGKEEPKKKKGKKTAVIDLQTGDTFIKNGNEYVITEYVDQIHGKDQRNMMQEPNTRIFKVFNCETSEIDTVRMNIDDEVEVIKKDNDLFDITYTKMRMINGEKVMEKHNMVMLAKTKSEVEERLGEKGNITLVKLEKLLHGKIKNKR